MVEPESKSYYTVLENFETKMSFQSRKPFHKVGDENNFTTEWALNQNMKPIRGSPLKRVQRQREISPFFLHSQADTTHCIYDLKINN